MIEFEGCIFDFENMDGIDAQGRAFVLMKLDNHFYWKKGCIFYGQWAAWPNHSGAWEYVFKDYNMSRKLYEQWEQWVIEEILLCNS